MASLAAARPGKKLKEGVKPTVLLFSNCKSNGRNNLTLRTSWDDGETWNDGYTICPSGSAYSDITVLPDGSVGVLYETAGYSSIAFDTVAPADFLKR